MAVDEKLFGIIAEQLSVDKEKVVPGASFVDDLGADSLGVWRNAFKADCYSRC